MKSLTKRFGALAAAGAMSLSLIVGTGLIKVENTFADDGKDHSDKYYYNHLSNDKLAENFYKAFETLADNGEFKKGTIEYDLIANNVATAEQVQSYVSGVSTDLVTAYGMGRDAFYLDHPDLFYADVFSTSISAGTDTDGNYVAYLDSSRALSTFIVGLNSQTVDAAITKYNNAVNAIVTKANELYSDIEMVQKIEYVNNYIIEHNEYGYGTVIVGDSYVDTDKAPFVHTSYGALVNGESVCEGYAKSFKAVMDRLEIPCVLVSGYLYNTKSATYEPHMWNNVQIEGMWYAVDVTNNDNDGWETKYLLCGSNDMLGDYVIENIVSATEVELPYPAIKPYAFGIDTDPNGIVIKGEYTDNDEGGRDLTLSISYDGKGAYKLEEEGLYLAWRQVYDQAEGKDVWSQWFSIVGANADYREMTEEGEDYYTVTDEYTIFPVISQIKYVQFAILSRNNDYAFGAYSEVNDSDFVVQPSASYGNDSYVHVDYAPYPIKATPGNTATLGLSTIHVTINYDRKLALADESKKPGIIVENFEQYKDIDKYYKLENFNWDGDKTITFDFTPSLQYEHYKATYFFTPDNLIDAENKLTPYAFKYVFAGENIMCNKMLPGGRYCVKSFGSPKLLSNSDLSMSDFVDDNGKHYAESQRSQLMLVASKPTADRENGMTDILKNDKNIADSDIVASSTFEIDLALCRNVKEVPKGSFLQVSFGFPEGYTPDDEGTTYKIYHYLHDDPTDKKKITGVEEIPVIVTPYGLIAQVQSFSPFTIVQLKNTSAAVTNSNTVNIYASVNGESGGTVKANGKSGIVEVTEDTITYDITADNGFTVGTVLLNGKVVDAEKYADGKLTLNKSDLDASNTLEVSFVTKTSAQAYAKKGFAPVYGSTNHVVASSDDIGNGNGGAAAAIAIGVVCGVVVLAAAGVAAWFVLRQKKNNKKPAAKKKKKA